MDVQISWLIPTEKLKKLELKTGPDGEVEKSWQFKLKSWILNFWALAWGKTPPSERPQKSLGRARRVRHLPAKDPKKPGARATRKTPPS